MASATTAIESSNPRLLQERIERSREQILRLQDEIDKYTDVATTIVDLPKKLQHHVMVPIGKRAMMPGKIVRSNEVLTHLGDEYFAWKSATDAVTVIERKKKELTKQIKSEMEAVSGLEEKKKEVDSILDIRKLYEDENITDIQETEEESDNYVAAPVTEEVVEQYFELEEEERRRNESAAWEWDEVMKRMEELEAMEERGDDAEDEETKNEPTVAQQVADLKAKGNAAFSKRRFAESIEFYSKAIVLDPQSHILYGNRSASLFRLKNYQHALEDANKAIDLDTSWVKGHYRKASALAALQRYQDAAAAYDAAFKLCPTDEKLKQQADEMRAKASEQQRVSKLSTSMPQKKVSFAPGIQPSVVERVASGHEAPAPRVSPPSTVAATVFSGEIKERAGENVAPAPVPIPAGGSSAAFLPRRSRFQGNNRDGDVVTLEPVGDAQPVKRVSRFKAQRSGAAQ